MDVPKTQGFQNFAAPAAVTRNLLLFAAAITLFALLLLGARSNILGSNRSESSTEIDEPGTHQQGPAPAADSDGVVSRETSDTPKQAEEYWNEERMRDAQPIPMPNPGNGGVSSTDTEDAEPSGGSTYEVDSVQGKD